MDSKYPEAGDQHLEKMRLIWRRLNWAPDTEALRKTWVTCAQLCAARDVVVDAEY